jgi:hypothetical protein
MKMDGTGRPGSRQLSSRDSDGSTRRTSLEVGPDGSAAPGPAQQAQAAIDYLAGVGGGDGVGVGGYGGGRAPRHRSQEIPERADRRSVRSDISVSPPRDPRNSRTRHRSTEVMQR